jgi:hypothetical protein
MFSQFRYSLEKAPVDLFAKVTFSSGAATVARGKGFTSITKNGTGLYDIVLKDKYFLLLAMSATCLNGSATPLASTAGGIWYVKAVNAAAGTLTIGSLQVSGLAAIEAKDATMLVSALKSAVAIIDSMPHEEGEHEGDEGEE